MNMRTITLAFAGFVSATLIWQDFDAARAELNAFTEEQLNLLSDVFERIHSDFVDQPSDERLIESAINGMLTSLDPHSTYIDAKTFREMLVQNKGKFGGLGIEGIMENGIIKTIAPIDDTPAARAGIMAGDLIIKIDGDSIQDMSMVEALGRMRGMINTPITLTIRRAGGAPYDVPLIRGHGRSCRASGLVHCIPGRIDGNVFRRAARRHFSVIAFLAAEPTNLSCPTPRVLPISF